MVTEAEVIARQAIKIMKLEDFQQDAIRAFEKIRMELVGIGGPLNDNKLGYTKEQMTQMQRVLEHTDFPGSSGYGS